MLVELFTGMCHLPLFFEISLLMTCSDPEGFINMMKELGSEIFGLESPEGKGSATALPWHVI